VYSKDTAGILTGRMLRFLPGTILNSNFILGVVEVMYDRSRMMNKEVSTVIVSRLYTMYVYLCNIYQCSLHYSTCRQL
jgi:hypothetical protein